MLCDSDLYEHRGLSPPPFGHSRFPLKPWMLDSAFHSKHMSIHRWSHQQNFPTDIHSIFLSKKCFPCVLRPVVHPSIPGNLTCRQFGSFFFFSLRKAQGCNSKKEPTPKTKLGRRWMSQMDRGTESLICRNSLLVENPEGCLENTDCSLYMGRVQSGNWVFQDRLV